ncbi:MAG: DNA-directed RNA polymerase subunit delta [Syntrophomonadaceae bacterium]|jgi:DNA-directed RNA polymerase subunit delta|nr:DNA-directed RNA polymerase subunit delta [Syntrophomonadaceae bacterium]
MVPRKKSEADWAVEILKEKQEAVFYLDLISAIADKMGKKKNSLVFSSINTRLNMDNRLVYQGEGYWFYDRNRVKE